MRVVSLIASATEIVCALGLEDELVGRSHECDFPASVEKLPVCTAPKFSVDGKSADIDREIRRILEQALSVYRVNPDALVKLYPTHIVTQTQCEVCAVSQRDVEEALKTYSTSASGNGAPRIVALQPDSLDRVFGDIHRVATALDVPERGDALVEKMHARMFAIFEKSRTLPRKRFVACIEWLDPLMASGNWMPELVHMAGGHNLYGKPGEQSPKLSWLEIAADNPEVILILPCGFDIDRTRREMPALTEQPGWKELKAVQNERVYLLDGNQYFNRPGPRLVESLEILAEVIHPEAFSFGHEGIGWVKL